MIFSYLINELGFFSGVFLDIVIYGNVVDTERLNDVRFDDERWNHKNVLELDTKLRQNKGIVQFEFNYNVS
jgi:hypothetical protein